MFRYYIYLKLLRNYTDQEDTDTVNTKYTHSLILPLPYDSSHSLLEIIVTSTFCRVEDGEPSDDVSPQPVTVASWSVNREATEAGRQTGPTAGEKVRAEARVRTHTSKSPLMWLKFG